MQASAHAGTPRFAILPLTKADAAVGRFYLMTGISFFQALVRRMRLFVKTLLFLRGRLTCDRDRVTRSSRSSKKAKTSRRNTLVRSIFDRQPR